MVIGCSQQLKHTACLFKGFKHYFKTSCLKVNSNKCVVEIKSENIQISMDNFEAEA